MTCPNLALCPDAPGSGVERPGARALESGGEQKAGAGQTLGKVGRGSPTQATAC